MTLDTQRLYSQGRAKSPTELWSPEENEFVHVLAKERGLSRPSAADYVRNGVLSLEDFDAAAQKDFKPEKLDDVVKDVVANLKGNAAKALKGKKK